ncbi:MAG: LemA family protein [Bacteroidales bacterium]|nr:LemA family protein [Bacteroidales bacterium]
MKTKSRGLIILLVILGIIAIWGVGKYNGFVTADEQVGEQWSNVESQYQRRLDLIPNLVNTVKGYADFEQETLVQVIEARAKASSVTVDPSNLTPEAIAQFQSAQDELSGALSRLLVTIERYPDLKANQNFLELQAQLEGTENRIQVERRKFNEAVRAFNTAVRRFPANIIASLTNFDEKGYFEATEGAETVPQVEF